MRRPSATAERATTVALFALPFVVFSWAAPFLSPHTLGSDYARYTVPQQLLLQFSLANGSFPLYLPRFAGGQSASAATQGQLYHPISHLAAHLPGYWSGGALELFTALNLLSLGFVLWALYHLLRELELDRTLSVVGALVTVFNLRMLELFRYAASLQSFVGYLLLCIALTRLFLHGPGYARGVCVAGATYLLLCSGHPQMAYLGLLGALLVLGCAAPVLRAIVPGPVPAHGTLAGCFASAVLALGAGVLLSAAYLLPFTLDFLPSAVQRTGKDFAWVYTPFGTRSVVSLLHSVFRPFSSDVHGSFGGPALLAVPLLVPLLLVLRRPPAAVVATWTIVLLVLALALAETLPLYFLAWKYLPFFSSFRVPGRVTLMLPFLLLLLFAWLCKAAPVRLGSGERARLLTPLTIVAAVATVLYAAYGLVSVPHYDALEVAPPIRFRKLTPVAEGGVFVLGVASLLLLTAYTARRSRPIALLLVLVVIAQATLVLRFGTWIAVKQPTTTWDEMARRHRIGVGRGNEDSGAGMRPTILVARDAALGKQAHQRPVRLYWDVRHAGSRDEAFARLRVGGEDLATIEAPAGGPLAGPLAQSFALPAHETPAASVRLVRATYNHFRFAVETAHPGLLVFAQPFSTRWRARVRAKRAPVGVANGAFLGVAVPAGASIVDLRYESIAARRGMQISLATAWLIVAAGALRARRRRLGLAALLAATLGAVALYTAWSGSLHSGRHLGTWYQWRTPSPASASAAAAAAAETEPATTTAAEP